MAPRVALAIPTPVAGRRPDRYAIQVGLADLQQVWGSVALPRCFMHRAPSVLHPGAPLLRDTPHSLACPPRFVAEVCPFHTENCVSSSKHRSFKLSEELYHTLHKNIKSTFQQIT